MAKRRRDADAANGTTAEATTCHTVFVDTSLDTHIAMSLNRSDTVSDFKKKIVLQHSECFPKTGAIIIHSLQVKRQGYFYHLPDSMLVSSAFEGCKRSWSLLVEASSSKADDKAHYLRMRDASEHVGLLQTQKHLQVDKDNLLSGDPLELAIEIVPQAVQASPSNFYGEISNMDIKGGHINKDLALMSELILQNTGDSANAARLEGENIGENNENTQGHDVDELPFEAGFTATKKRKIQQKENVRSESTLNTSISSRHRIGSNRSNDEIVAVEIPLDDHVGVPIHLQIRESDVTEEPRKTSSSNMNTMSKSGAKEASQSALTAEKIQEPRRVESLKSARDGLEDLTSLHLSSHELEEDHLLTSVGSKEGKKKSKMTFLNPHDQANTSEFNHLVHGSAQPGDLYSQALQTDQSEGHIVELALNRDHEVMLSEGCKTSDQVEESGTVNKLIVTSRPVEAVDSSGSKGKKKKSKEKASGVPIYVTEEETNITHVVSAAVQNLASKDHISDKTESDHEVMLSENCKPLAQMTSMTDIPGEAGTKNKRKKAKKKASGAEMYTVEEETNNMNVITSALSNLAPRDQIKDKTKSDRGVFSSETLASKDHISDKTQSDGEVMLSEKCKPSDQVEVDATNKESIISQTPSMTNMPREVGSEKKRKKAKKKALGVQTYTLEEEINNTNVITSVLPNLAFRDQISDETESDRGVLPSEKCTPSDQSLTNMPIEANSSVTKEKKKKKKNKKNASGAQMYSLVEETTSSNAITSALPNLAPKDHRSDQTENDERILSYDETDQRHNNEEERGLMVNYAFELPLSDSCERLDQGEAAKLMNKESVILLKLSGANEAAEVGNSSSTKMTRRKAKNSASKIQGNSDTEHELNSLSGTSSPVEDVALDRQNNDGGKKNESSVPHSETNRSNKIEGEKELSLRRGSNVILSMQSKPLDSSETDMKDKESIFPATALDNEASLETGKSVQTQKKRRVKKSTTTSNHTALELANAAIAVSPATDPPAKNFANETTNDQSILPCTEETEASKVELNYGSTSGALKKSNKARKNKKIVLPLRESGQTQENMEYMDNNVTEDATNNQSMDRNAPQDPPSEEQANDIQCLQLDHPDREQENAGTENKKAKKKMKKGQKSAAENCISRPEEQNYGLGNLSALSEKPSKGNITYKTGKMNGLAAARTVDKSGDSELGLKKNSKGRPETVDNIEKDIKTAKGEDEGINFRHYFVPGQHLSEFSSVDKVKETLHSLEAEKKAESIVSKDAHKLCENQGRNASGNEIKESSSHAKRNEDMPWTDEETSKASENGIRTPRIRDLDKVKTLHKATEPSVTNGSGSRKIAPARREDSDGSLTSSSSKGSKRVLPTISNRKQQACFNDYGMARKFSRENGGDLVNSSQKEKNLLTSKVAIFMDGSSESSRDDYGNENSDTSTRTPSDNSSSSGNSDGESELSQDSRREGPVKDKRKDGGRDNVFNAKFSGPKQLSMDMILRSSSRFKKAKLSASQSQEPDTESQPVDFVPESQA